jgi:hypothetical protein
MEEFHDKSAIEDSNWVLPEHESVVLPLYHHTFSLLQLFSVPLEDCGKYLCQLVTTDSVKSRAMCNNATVICLKLSNLQDQG